MQTFKAYLIAICAAAAVGSAYAGSWEGIVHSFGSSNSLVKEVNQRQRDGHKDRNNNNNRDSAQDRRNREDQKSRDARDNTLDRKTDGQKPTAASCEGSDPMPHYINNWLNNDGSKDTRWHWNNWVAKNRPPKEDGAAACQDYFTRRSEECERVLGTKSPGACYATCTDDYQNLVKYYCPK